MATSSKTGKQPGTAPAATVSGAQRRQNAASRLADTKQTLAALAQDIADLQFQIDAAASMESTAQRAVSVAEQAADLAAAAVIDKQAAMLVADGGPDEAAAEKAYDGAIAGNASARKALDEARTTLADLHSKNVAAEATANAAMAELEAKQRNAHRLAQSLEHQYAQAHRQAGIEALAVLHEKHPVLAATMEQKRQAVTDAQADLDAHRESVETLGAEYPDLLQSRQYHEMVDPAASVREICLAYVQYLDVLEKWRSHPAPIEHLHAGHSLPHVLAPDQLNRNTLHNILWDSAETPANDQSSWIIGLTRSNVLEMLADLDAQRERKLAGLPSAK